MTLAKMHKEDVKSELRKRFGSVAAFERSAGIPEKSVADVLRGRASKRVLAAVEDALTDSSTSRQSEVSDDSSADSHVHRLNAEVR